MQQGPGPSLSSAASACPAAPRNYLSGTLTVNPISHLSRVPLGVDPTLPGDCSKSKVAMCSLHQRGIRGITLVGILLDVIRQGEPGGITLDGPHLRGCTTKSSSGRGERGFTICNHQRCAILQRYHQECSTRYHPRHSIVALQSRTT